MGTITLLLGFVLFLPYYCSGLENRLKTERVFRPFRLFENLRARNAKSNVLPVFGVFLIFVGLILSVLTDSGSPMSGGDKIRILAGGVMVFYGFFYGYMKESFLKGNGEIGLGVGRVLSALPFYERRSCFFKALKDFGWVLMFVVFFVLLGFIF
ncbi:hypothetical protein HX881_20500 [Pseudomonas gingeri]|uniref:hypothetical protein n=1 Tax=Pseudomonas gingeri TaxID=117681 RepID=UPI0015A26604|nr:hypothetical protein [Pseudomonas gingeri]NVZ27945.1 hypothetical protein [Pseudomonas gingeri]